MRSPLSWALPPTPNPKHSSSPPIASATHARSASPQLPVGASAGRGTITRRLAPLCSHPQSTRRPLSPRRSSRPYPTRPRATHPLRPFLRRVARALLSSVYPPCWATTPPPRRFERPAALPAAHPLPPQLPICVTLGARIRSRVVYGRP